MWTIEKLTKRFSMSDQQIYRRIQAAQKPLCDHIKRGEKNCIELSEGGFLILENVIELEKQGKTLANAVQEVQNSMQAPPTAQHSPYMTFEMPGTTVQNTFGNNQKLPETDYHSLVQELGYLKGMVDSKNERLTELKDELARVRQEFDDLRRSASLVEYQANQQRGRWWPWR